MVEDDGYLFATVEPGREMRGALDKGNYDIVIIDVTSPPDDGLRSLRSPVSRDAG